MSFSAACKALIGQRASARLKSCPDTRRLDGFHPGGRHITVHPESESSPFLAIARIVKPQGRRGEVSAETLTDFPERFKGRARFYLGSPEVATRLFFLQHAWLHQGRMILKFSGVDSIEQAERLRGLHVLIPWGERSPLPENSYYWSELCGCRVVTDSADRRVEIGTVRAVEPTGGVALLHVGHGDSENDEVLIPLAQAICKQIDTEAKLIVIDPPGDLLDLNERASGT